MLFRTSRLGRQKLIVPQGLKKPLWKTSPYDIWLTLRTRRVCDRDVHSKTPTDRLTTKTALGTYLHNNRPDRKQLRPSKKADPIILKPAFMANQHQKVSDAGLQ